MDKYILISVFEREIMTEIFDDPEAARAQMMRELFDEFKKEDMEIVYHPEGVEDEEKFGYGTSWAWSNIDDNCMCDWKIVKL